LTGRLGVKGRVKVLEIKVLWGINNECIIIFVAFFISVLLYQTNAYDSVDFVQICQRPFLWHEEEKYYNPDQTLSFLILPLSIHPVPWRANQLPKTCFSLCHFAIQESVMASNCLLDKP
jgi:hypothetical protein